VQPFSDSGIFTYTFLDFSGVWVAAGADVGLVRPFNLSTDLNLAPGDSADWVRNLDLCVNDEVAAHGEHDASGLGEDARPDPNGSHVEQT
jgi:hypothetical protein